MASNPASVSKTTADLIYDSFYSGAVGGSVVALFFLLVDTLQGQALFTPSLLGSVLFSGASADTAATVRLDMVAYFSIVHFGVFMALGTFLSFLVHEVELHTRHPGEVLGFLFVVLELAFFITAWLLLPGVISKLGVARIFVANLLAAGSMGLFLLGSHRPDLWQRFKHAALG